MAHDDVKVALGLLDARHIAGDESLTAQLIAAAARPVAAHRRPAAARLREVTTARWQAHGELAFLLEGDLKEAAGGLRDVGVLRGIAHAGISRRAAPGRTRRPPAPARHPRRAARRRRPAGRPPGRAGARGRRRAARPRRRRRAAAPGRRRRPYRRHALDDAWRAADRLARRPRGARRGADGRPLRRPVARDVVEHDGELVLARTAIGARPDSSLSLRVAAAAASARLPIARATCEWLAAYCPPLPAPVAARRPGPR